MDSLLPIIKSATDYYAFGSPIEDRMYQADGYRYGFNGKQDDDEVNGVGNFQDYGFRYYDPRIARFMSADPLIVSEQKYPELSSYQFASNTPLQATDLDGLEAYHFSRIVDKNGNTTALKPMYQRQIIDHTLKSFLGLESPKINQRKEYVVHNLDQNHYLETVYGTQKYEYDETAKFNSFNEALKSTSKDFDGTSMDMAHYMVQGISNVGNATRENGGPIDGPNSTGWKGRVDYSDIPDPKNVGVGKQFKNIKQRNAIFDKNRSANNGILRDDSNGTFLNKGRKGGNDPKQAEIDHSRARAKGGDNSSKNAQVLSKQNNRKKGTN
jgi:RHS repeat-associated protein